jgi:hypothetical protein
MRRRLTRRRAAFQAAPQSSIAATTRPDRKRSEACLPPRAGRLPIGRRLPTGPTLRCMPQRFSGLVLQEGGFFSISTQWLRLGRMSSYGFSGSSLLIMSSPLPICLSGVKMRKRRVAVVVAMLGVCGVARSQPIASVHGAPIGSIVTVNGVLTAKPLLTARDKLHLVSSGRVRRHLSLHRYPGHDNSVQRRRPAPRHGQTGFL